MEHFAYLHGFASSSLSTKGQRFARGFAEHGHELCLPELNRPDFARLTISGALEAFDELVERSGPGRWGLIGSSMGGWVASLWARRHPERVGKVVLLCPGFGLVERWPEMIGPEAMEAWEREGTLEWPDGAGRPTPVHWGFVEDARAHDPRPAPAAPTLVFHGRGDEVVPVESSRRWATEHPEQVTLVELEADHRMHESVELVLTRAMSFFELVP